MCVYIYIYIYIHTYRGLPRRDAARRHQAAAPTFEQRHLSGGTTCLTLRDKNSYTTTNKCLQRLIKIMYRVFKIIGVYV